MDLYQHWRMDSGWNCRKDLEFALEFVMEVVDQDWDMLLEEGKMCWSRVGMGRHSQSANV